MRCTHAKQITQAEIRVKCFHKSVLTSTAAYTEPYSYTELEENRIIPHLFCCSPHSRAKSLKQLIVCHQSGNLLSNQLTLEDFLRLLLVQTTTSLSGCLLRKSKYSLNYNKINMKKNSLY